MDDRVIDALHAAGIVYECFECDPNLADTAAFCEHYGFDLADSANTIIVASKTDPKIYAACIILATTKCDVNKTVCSLLGVKRASFASGEQTTELTGMMIGGVTPFGLPTDLPVFIDSAVTKRKQVVTGGGNRSTKVILDPRELTKLPKVTVVDGLAVEKTA